ncbi:Translation initiation factor IF2/IF5 domain - like 2 [Theobroma cacao]|nr:Translation initiation factor IF2/IF5 domain - like 2 [Theobroma cacao]
MADDEVKDEVAEITPFDPTKKKKKKKVVIQDPADDSVDKLAEKTEALSVSDGLDFTSMKKKKKKQVEASTLNEESGDAGDDFDDHIDGDEEGDGIVLQQRYPWEGSDRDYEYEELLGRVFNILRENNPELAGDRRRTVMRPPQVLREGTKKTVFVNFMDLCKTMHRQPDHVMAFLLAELGTSGSLDGQQRLVVKGRFAPKNFEGILRRYINEYVICLGCKSPDTILSKENRLFFLRCEKVTKFTFFSNSLHLSMLNMLDSPYIHSDDNESNKSEIVSLVNEKMKVLKTPCLLELLVLDVAFICGSGRSVAPIKAGFVARVGRRNTGT